MCLSLQGKCKHIAAVLLRFAADAGSFRDAAGTQSNSSLSLPPPLSDSQVDALTRVQVGPVPAATIDAAFLRSVASRCDRDPQASVSVDTASASAAVASVSDVAHPGAGKETALVGMDGGTSAEGIKHAVEPVGATPSPETTAATAGIRGVEAGTTKGSAQRSTTHGHGKDHTSSVAAVEELNPFNRRLAELHRARLKRKKQNSDEVVAPEEHGAVPSEHGAVTGERGPVPGAPRRGDSVAHATMPAASSSRHSGSDSATPPPVASFNLPTPTNPSLHNASSLATTASSSPPTALDQSAASLGAAGAARPPRKAVQGSTSKQAPWKHHGEDSATTESDSDDEGWAARLDALLASPRTAKPLEAADRCRGSGTTPSEGAVGTDTRQRWPGYPSAWWLVLLVLVLEFTVRVCAGAASGGGLDGQNINPKDARSNGDGVGADPTHGDGVGADPTHGDAVGADPAHGDAVGAADPATVPQKKKRRRVLPSWMLPKPPKEPKPRAKKAPRSSRKRQATASTKRGATAKRRAVKRPRRARGPKDSGTGLAAGSQLKKRRAARENKEKNRSNDAPAHDDRGRRRKPERAPRGASSSLSQIGDLLFPSESSDDNADFEAYLRDKEERRKVLARHDAAASSSLSYNADVSQMHTDSAGPGLSGKGSVLFVCVCVCVVCLFACVCCFFVCVWKPAPLCSGGGVHGWVACCCCCWCGRTCRLVGGATWHDQSAGTTTTLASGACSSCTVKQKTTPHPIFHAQSSPRCPTKT